MGVMDKVKSWLFGKHEEREMKASPEPPMQQQGTIIYEEEGTRTEPPEIDEYVDIEFKKPAPEGHSTTPMEGTTMVKKKTTRKKTAKKRTTKKRTTKRKTTRKKTTKKKTTKRKTTKKTTKRKTTKKKTTKRKTTKKKSTTRKKK